MDSGEAARILQNLIGLQAGECEATIYLAREDSRSHQLAYAALTVSAALATKFKETAISRLHAIGELKDDLELRPLETMAKLEEYQVEWLDISLLPAITSRVQEVPKQVVEVPVFDERNDTLAGTPKFYVIDLKPKDRERVLFFRKFYLKNELRRSKLFAAVFSNGVFDRMVQPTLLFDEHFDCFAQGNAIILRKGDFQSLFGYFEQLQRKATDCLQRINAVVPIVNFNEFVMSCGSHKQKLMKLANINDSPNLQNVTIADLRKVIEKFSLKGVSIVTHEGKEHLKFDPAYRWVILKLLDDDYLSSVMTENTYEVNSKRKLS